MEKQIIPTGSNPRVFVETKGNLNVKGDTDEEVIVRADSAEDLKVETEDDEIRINCLGDLALRVPRGAHLKVNQVHGSATFKVLEGPITVQKVYGNLSLKDTGPVSIGQVMGELRANQVDGDLEIDGVNGDARILEVQGDLTINKEVKGNLKVVDIEGDASAHAKGNIYLQLDPRAGQKMEFQADGNFICRLAYDASITIEVLKAGGIKVNLPGIDAEKERIPFEITLGEGDAELTLSARGHVLLGELAPDWEIGPLDTDFERMGEDISDQIASQMETQMQFMESQLEAQLENLAISLEGAGLSSEAAERMARKAREASARATARAQEKMKRAQEKIQRKVEAAHRKAEARSRASERRSARYERQNWDFDWPSGQAQGQQAASDPVSDEERLMILKMLEENKISPEEAEKLLEALEGK